MTHPSKVGQLVKFIPARFNYDMLEDDYSNATVSEIYKITKVEDLDAVEDSWNSITSFVNISPIANPYVEITGLYASRFHLLPTRITKTKTIKD